MLKLRQHIAFLLLAVYSVIFAHNVIPHDHHFGIASELMSSVQQLECEHHHGSGIEAHSEGLRHHHHTADTELHHHHEHDDHAACHFDVRPVTSKTMALPMFAYVVAIIQLNEPVNEITNHQIDYFPQKLLEGYNYAVPLRAPPAIA
ncbi:hypothetical protein [Carboxylicivirga sp. M1479]|uniref:hypothetical protein n=1 Tax=Carboxylicivirga sp. M1479 TaxID=2594476 RepID=UPI001177ECBF|nr:hypothetical protein [Carboxylicivirga sp. M1479]TRX65958.1 hypothetical protein FNN09_15770 [Carboxylicivirga sp. M1479]